MECFTVVVDTYLDYIGSANPSIEEINGYLSSIENYCESKNISFVQSISSPSLSVFFNSFYEMYEIVEIAKKTRNNKAFYLILSNNNDMIQDFYEAYKYSVIKLEIDKPFKNITDNDNFISYAEKVNVYNIIPIVLEFNMTSTKWDTIVKDFIRRILVKYVPLSEALVDFRLERQYFTNTFTLGKLFKNNEPYCFTVEDTVRFSTEKCKLFDPFKDYPSGLTTCTSVKKIDFTAIPCGTYKVENRWSGKFWCINEKNEKKSYVPKLITIGGLQPPCFTEIAMHSGSSANSSSGCLIMSTQISNKEQGRVVNNGRPLMDDIYRMIDGGYGKIEITQKIDGEDLNQNHINEMKKGKVFGDINTIL